jgi:hypothetical protein
LACGVDETGEENQHDGEENISYFEQRGTFRNALGSNAGGQ